MGNGKQEAQVTEAQEEIQEEAQEAVLDDIMKNVTLGDPLEIPLNSGQILTITQEQFISYYMPQDATRLEKANCFNEVRAAGLNPAIRGDCHFFRTQGQPMHLFIGYHVYLRHAYKNGLTHIQKPVIEYGDDGHPLSCTITLEIEGRPDFEWTTWFWEVAATGRDGKLNARWEKAEIHMLIKCSVINNLRMSGLVDFTLPPAVEEMDDGAAPGHRRLTQEALDAYEPQEGEQEAALGEVSATNHQVDMTPFRKKYFKALKAQGILQDDTIRRQWEEEIIGIESISNWGVESYADALDLIASGAVRTWEAGYGQEETSSEPDDHDTETEQVDGMSPEEAKREAEARAAYAEEAEEEATMRPDWGAVKQKADEEQAELATGEPDPELEAVQNEYDAFSASVFETPAALTQWESIISDVPISKWDVLKYRAAIAGLKALKDARVEVMDVSDREALMKSYQEAIKGLWDCTQDMTQFQRKVAGHNSCSDFNTNELKTAYIIARSLKAVQIEPSKWPEVGEDFKVEDSEPAKEPTQPAVDPDADLPFLITDDTVKEIGEALLKFPDLKYLTIKSRAFRTFAFKAIDHDYVAFRKILDEDGKLILDALNEELAVGTTDKQIADMKGLLQIMPERFHQSIGSTEFLALVSKVIERPHKGGFGTVSAKEAAKVITRMEEIIRDEQDKAMEAE